MKCPRCGADNAERAEWCYLCEYAFAPGSAVVEPPAPDEAIQAQYPPPGGVPPSQQAVPPPPVGGIAYQPPPPGAYPAGYQPPPPVPKGPVTVKVVIGALILVVLVILAVGAYFLLRSDFYKIEVSTPPGYKEADADVFNEFEKSMGEQSEDVEIDYIFVDNSMTSYIIVVHQDIPTVFSTDAPPTDDPEAMEEWFYKNEEEIVGELEEEVALSGPISSELELYEVERLASGEAVLHIAMTLTAMNATVYFDFLEIIKGDTDFNFIIQSLNNKPDTVEFLKENTTFKK